MIAIHLQKHLQASSGKMKLDVAFQLQKGQFLSIYGKSGMGKTSILRMMAGLMRPDAGYIRLADATWYDAKGKVCLRPQQRNVGFVFQNYALFPNMTIRQNLAFALKKGQKKDIIHELMEVMELEKLQNRNPKTLSGGQQQRVALARALVQQPQILLLDEPLSALDTDMRSKLQAYILELHQRYALTTILVSHNLHEVAHLSDEVIELDEGKIVWQGDIDRFLIHKNPALALKMEAVVTAITYEGSTAHITLSLQQQTIKIQRARQQVQLLKIGDTFKLF